MIAIGQRAIMREGGVVAIVILTEHRGRPRERSEDLPVVDIGGLLLQMCIRDSLEALRLVRRLEHGVQALPALHRYAIAEPLA